MNFNRKLMAKWITALRSGEYQQGQGRLCQPNPAEQGEYLYCCLGVLQDIEPRIKRQKTYHLLDTTSLANHLGVSPDQPAVLHLVSKCVTWNDDTRLSFKEIADQLENSYLK